MKSALSSTEILPRFSKICPVDVYIASFAAPAVESAVLSGDSPQLAARQLAEEKARHSPRSATQQSKVSAASRLLLCLPTDHPQATARPSRRMAGTLDRPALRAPPRNGQSLISHRSRERSGGPNNQVSHCRKRLLRRFHVALVSALRLDRRAVCVVGLKWPPAELASAALQSPNSWT